MATTIADDQGPSVWTKTASRLDWRLRMAFLLAVGAVVIALAPTPFDAVGAASLTLLAFEAGRRR